MTSNKPAKHIRLAKVEATIWRNTLTNGPAFTIDLQRVYQDAKGSWKATRTLRPYDLSVAADVLKQADAWIKAQGPATPAAVTAGE